MEIKELEEGHKVLFNDRKQPLEVVEKREDEAEVEGPGGAVYILYQDEGTDLVANKGKKRYSSYLEDLRKVGEWKENEDGWIHSKTGAEIKVAEEEPVWKVKVKKSDISVDQPKYGFTDKENAFEKAEQVVRKHPEGKTDEEG